MRKLLLVILAMPFALLAKSQDRNDTRRSGEQHQRETKTPEKNNEGGGGGGPKGEGGPKGGERTVVDRTPQSQNTGHNGGSAADKLVDQTIKDIKALHNAREQMKKDLGWNPDFDRPKSHNFIDGVIRGMGPKEHDPAKNGEKSTPKADQQQPTTLPSHIERRSHPDGRSPIEEDEHRQRTNIEKPYIRDTNFGETDLGEFTTVGRPTPPPPITYKDDVIGYKVEPNKNVRVTVWIYKDNQALSLTGVKGTYEVTELSKPNKYVFEVNGGWLGKTLVMSSYPRGSYQINPYRNTSSTTTHLRVKIGNRQDWSFEDVKIEITPID